MSHKENEPLDGQTSFTEKPGEVFPGRSASPLETKSLGENYQSVI